MRIAGWLAWRELGTRPGRFALAGAVVAAAVAFCAGSEMLARARESAVEARMDQIGPPLRVVPAGVTGGALARLDLEGRLLPPGLEGELRRAVLGLRRLEARLIIERPVAGRGAPLVGVPADGLAGARSLGPGQVALGPALAAQVGAHPGDEVSVGRERWRVAAVLPSAASADDAAAWAPLGAVQELARAPGAVNELRLYLRPGHPAEAAEAAVRGLGAPASIVRSDRGEVAERSVPESLRRHRLAGYAVASAAVALVLLIAAHLDASERRVEMATLVAVGGSHATVVGTVVARSALVGATGAVVGVALGAAIAIVQDPGALPLARVVPVAGLALLGAVALGMAAAAPVAVGAAVRDPVSDLQEG